MKYIIFERYQLWSTDGKIWTQWFTCIGSPKFDDEKTAKSYIKEQLKPMSVYIDAKTKLKHEFEIREIDESELIVRKPHYNRKGRPTKEEKQNFDIQTADYKRRFECWKKQNRNF